MIGEYFRDPRIEFETLSPVPIITVAAAGHPLADRMRHRPPGGMIELSELADHLQIVIEDPTSLSDGRTFDVLSPETWRVSSQEAKRSLILAGLGWGRLPLWAVEGDLAGGRLLRLPAPGLGHQGEIGLNAYLAHHTDAWPGPAAQVLRQALLRAAGR